jgi:hypothetical protein
MYRVELKAQTSLSKTVCLSLFLMYRVELKVLGFPTYPTSGIDRVPNVPCGVER